MRFSPLLQFCNIGIYRKVATDVPGNVIYNYEERYCALRRKNISSSVLCYFP